MEGETWTSGQEILPGTQSPSGWPIDWAGTDVEGRRGNPTAHRRLSRADHVGRLPSPPSVARGDGRRLLCQDGSVEEENDSPFCPSGQCLSTRLGMLKVHCQLFLCVLRVMYEIARPTAENGKETAITQERKNKRSIIEQRLQLIFIKESHTMQIVRIYVQYDARSHFVIF
jgi:hypothetical protein